MTFPVPATLQCIPVSDRGEEPACDEQYEAEYDSSDSASTYPASQKDLRIAPSDESAGRLPAGPATLWGILLSKADLAERDRPDMNTMINLWKAAGYDCSPPSAEEEE